MVAAKVVWENIFGWWNPWSEADRALLRRCVRLLRQYSNAFQDPGWQPYVATQVEGVYAHRWHSGDTILHTLINETGAAVDCPLLPAPAAAPDGRSMRHYDLWNGAEIKPVPQGDAHLLSVSMASGAAGCIVNAPDGVDIDLRAALAEPEIDGAPGIDRRRITVADLSPRPVEAFPTGRHRGETGGDVPRAGWPRQLRGTPQQPNTNGRGMLRQDRSSLGQIPSPAFHRTGGILDRSHRGHQ